MYIDQPSNLTVTDGSNIMWSGCLGATYRVVVTRINDSQPVATTNVTLSTTTSVPNLEQSQDYNVSVTAIGMSCTSESATTTFIGQAHFPSTTASKLMALPVIQLLTTFCSSCDRYY